MWRELPFKAQWTQTSLDPRPCARKGLGRNLAQKCFEGWNAGVGVDEGKNTLQPTGIQGGVTPYSYSCDCKVKT